MTTKILFILLFTLSLTVSAYAGDSFEQEIGVVVLLANFQNRSRSLISPAVAREMVFEGAESLRAFVEENSYGQVTLFGGVHGWYTLPLQAPRSPRECDKYDYEFQDEIIKQAFELADRKIDYNLYKHLIVIHPKIPCFGLAGGGKTMRLTSDDYDGTKSFKVVIINGSLTPYTLAQEFGHNLNLGHAYAFECGDVSTITPITRHPEECQSWEYEDHYSAMGTTFMHYSASQKEYLEWFDDNHQIYEVTASDRYLITPFSSQEEGIKAIKILKEEGPNEEQPLGPIYYYLEFRQPIGIDARLPRNHPTYQGLLIHQGGPHYTGNESELLDMTPNSHPEYTELLVKNPYLGAHDFMDAALPIGSVYLDEARGVEFRPVEITDQGILVDITFD